MKLSMIYLNIYISLNKKYKISWNPAKMIVHDNYITLINIYQFDTDIYLRFVSADDEI